MPFVPSRFAPCHSTLRWLSVLCVCLLAACAAPPAPPARPLPLADALITSAPAAAFEPLRLFEMSDEMRRYASGFERAGVGRDRREALVHALYTSNELQITYDAAGTRTAAETFTARSGNCLSLVLLTAAFAKHLGMPVGYQRVYVDDEYSRRSGMHFVTGHVNVTLGQPVAVASRLAEIAWLTVDFLPQADLRNVRAEPIEERTVIAMYLNNVAADALAAGRPHEAYWRAREALLRDANFAAAANTLGVVYERLGHAGAAERAYGYVLEHEARNTTALANLARLLKEEGRQAEAKVFEARLQELQPVAPFAYLEQGHAALARGDAAAARDLFKRELRLQPFQHEVHFWLAQAYAKLGDSRAAQQHLMLAAEYSPGPKARGVYSAKLQQLRTPVQQ